MGCSERLMHRSPNPRRNGANRRNDALIRRKAALGAELLESRKVMSSFALDGLQVKVAPMPQLVAVGTYDAGGSPRPFLAAPYQDGTSGGISVSLGDGNGKFFKQQQISLGLQSTEGIAIGHFTNSGF